MNITLRLLLISVIVSLSTRAYTQNEPVLSLGGGVGMGFGVNESTERSLGFSSRLSVLYANGFGKYLSPEIGLNTLSLSSGKEGRYNDYATSVVVPDLRLLITPYGLNRWSPYLFGALGYALRSVSYRSYNADTAIPNTGGDIAFGGGLGLFHKIGTNWAINFHLGGMITTADNLNPATDGKNDGWWQGMITFHYLFGGDDDHTPITQEKSPSPNLDDTDEDKDGLSKREETDVYHTNPAKPDTDGDGLLDGDEAKKFRSNPNDRETDKDGLGDGDEVRKYKTNPASRDTDGDKLGDGDEVNKFGTDPLKADTDGDGISDGDETNTHKTNPLARDTDGDQLDDADEILKHKTNPLNPDTDKDGTLDGPEVRRGTDPNKSSK